MPQKKNPEVTRETERRLREVMRCQDDFVYFANTYCHILATNDRAGAWAPFRLWPAQERVARDLQVHREVVILKARQLGFTWLVLAFALHQLLFRPVATILLFSKRDDEAAELLGFRLREMYLRLPEWMRTTELTADTAHVIEFPNGSRAMAFSTTGGRSYTATLAIIDEADHVPDLEKMLNAIKPTIDAGGRLILLSTVDKSQPESSFKKIYRAARQGQNSYHPIFHGWRAAPWRTDEWYEQMRRTSLAETGALDNLHQEYPATDIEALSPRSLDKRIPAPWLQQCFSEVPPIPADSAFPPAMRLPAIPGLAVYARPRPDRMYVLGADPAEGNPTSDDSALEVLDCATGEEVASLTGKLEPSLFAHYAHQIACYFNRAAIMCERNNHGHAVLLWLRNAGHGVQRLCGHDTKEGWMTSSHGKILLYDTCAEAFRNKAVLLHSFATYMQLSGIDGSTLRAPDGQHDDRADAFALAVCGQVAAIEASAGDGIPIILGPAPNVFAPYRPEEDWSRVGSIGDEPPPTMKDTSWY
jgi:hypothetical protein